MYKYKFSNFMIYLVANPAQQSCFRLKKHKVQEGVAFDYKWLESEEEKNIVESAVWSDKRFA